MYQSNAAPWLWFRAWATDGSAKTDLVYNTSGISIKVARDNQADSSALSLSAASGPTDWAAGKLHQVVGNLYKVGIATASISAYTGNIAVCGSYTGGTIEGVIDQVSAYNPAYEPLRPTTAGRTFNVNTDGEGDAVLNATTQTQINNIETGTNTLLSRVTTTVVTLWANLTAMITGSGASAKYTTGALSNAPGSEATISQEGLDTIIAGVQAVHLNITEAVENCGFSITSGDTWVQSVTGLGNLADKKVTFAIKADRRNADSESIALLDETYGLFYLNSAFTTPEWGSITINDETAGDITLRLESNATKLIPAGKYIDAIKVIKDNADFSLRNAGTTTVLCGVIKEIS